ncbi:MAG: hypothetical protein AAGB34_07250 [Planctomycetota bacterium]
MTLKKETHAKDKPQRTSIVTWIAAIAAVVSAAIGGAHLFRVAMPLASADLRLAEFAASEKQIAINRLTQSNVGYFFSVSLPNDPMPIEGGDYLITLKPEHSVHNNGQQSFAVLAFGMKIWQSPLEGQSVEVGTPNTHPLATMSPPEWFSDPRTYKSTAPSIFEWSPIYSETKVAIPNVGHMDNTTDEIMMSIVFAKYASWGELEQLSLQEKIKKTLDEYDSPDTDSSLLFSQHFLTFSTTGSEVSTIESNELVHVIPNDTYTRTSLLITKLAPGSAIGWSGFCLIEFPDGSTQLERYSGLTTLHQKH